MHEYLNWISSLLQKSSVLSARLAAVHLKCQTMHSNVSAMAMQLANSRATYELEDIMLDIGYDNRAAAYLFTINYE